MTDEILEELIKDHEFVAVFFRGPCDEEGDDCDAVLAKLESNDDDLDEQQICTNVLYTCLPSA